MQKQEYKVGDCLIMRCEACDEDRGHIIRSVNKNGAPSRILCPKCDTLRPYKKILAVVNGEGFYDQTAAPYNPEMCYRKGQALTHHVYGFGEVVLVMDGRKMDVLFRDRVRRLVHIRPSGESDPSVGGREILPTV